MADDEAVPGQKKARIRGFKKRIIPYEQSDPATEPLFINYVHGAFVGRSAYLDVGLIPIDEFERAPDAPEPITVDFAVLTRLVMSKGTLILIRDQINDLLTRGEIASVIRRVSSTLRHPAWEFSDVAPLSLGRVAPAY